MPLTYLPEADPAVADALRQELARERDSVELIASENFTSPAVLEAVGSVLTNKYAEGYPRKRYYGGCEKVDIVEDLARDRACALFGANFANVQPHCGANANFGAYTALLELGDTVLGMSLDQGGHLTHGSPVNFSGRYYNFASYGVDPETETIDYDEVERIAKEVRPKLIVGGASAYPRIIDFERMAAIAREVDAYFMVDMAHIAGLVAAGAHPSPVPHADVVTSTSHKTLRGPRGGFILTNDEGIAKRIDRPCSPARRAARSCTSSPARPSRSARPSSPPTRSTSRASWRTPARSARACWTAACASCPAAPTTTCASWTSRPPTSPARTPRSCSRAWASR